MPTESKSPVVLGTRSKSTIMADKSGDQVTIQGDRLVGETGNVILVGSAAQLKDYAQNSGLRLVAAFQ